VAGARRKKPFLFLEKHRSHLTLGVLIRRFCALRDLKISAAGAGSR
jgi:hypothetical protein